MKKITAEEIIKKLQLMPLIDEGGLYRQTYKSSIMVSQKDLPPRYTGDRSISTQIYYLLTDDDDSFSAMHRLPGDEVYHFYLGDPVEMLLLLPDGTSQIMVLGSDLLLGQHFQLVVLHSVWQGLRLLDAGKFAMLGTSMSPGFEFADSELGDREMLIQEYPEQRKLIEGLTRGGMR